LVDGLAEESVEGIVFSDCVVEARISTRNIGTDAEEIFIFAVEGEGFASFGSGLKVFWGRDIADESADAFEDIDSGKVIGGREASGEDNVTVENTANGIGDGFIHVVAFDEDGIKSGDGAAVGGAGSFEKFWQ